MLARLGITSLFLFAGMEIDIENLKSNTKPLSKHVSKFLILIVLTTVVFVSVFEVSNLTGVLISVAILTPSAGFILSSLQSYELTEKEVYWIKLKAICQEMAAIVILLFVLQADSVSSILQVLLGYAVMILVLPSVFRFFLKYIAPFAPKSEVSFLIIIAFITGIIAKKLGTHYLVGAFITGIVAGQFNHFVSSKEATRILDSLAAFFYIFVPFYFFKAGLAVTGDMLTTSGLFIGLLLAAIFIPFRLWSICMSVKYFLEASIGHRVKIAVALTPNLIFGLVVVGILQDTLAVGPSLLSGLVVYTVLASSLPALYFDKVPPENYDLTRFSDTAD